MEKMFLSVELFVTSCFVSHTMDDQVDVSFVYWSLLVQIYRVYHLAEEFISTVGTAHLT